MQKFAKICILNSFNLFPQSRIRFRDRQKHCELRAASRFDTEYERVEHLLPSDHSVPHEPVQNSSFGPETTSDLCDHNFRHGR